MTALETVRYVRRHGMPAYADQYGNVYATVQWSRLEDDGRVTFGESTELVPHRSVRQVQDWLGY